MSRLWRSSVRGLRLLRGAVTVRQSRFHDWRTTGATGALLVLRQPRQSCIPLKGDTISLARAGAVQDPGRTGALLARLTGDRLESMFGIWNGGPGAVTRRRSGASLAGIVAAVPASCSPRSDR